MESHSVHFLVKRCHTSKPPPPQLAISEKSPAVERGGHSWSGQKHVTEAACTATAYVVPLTAWFCVHSSCFALLSHKPRRSVPPNSFHYIGGNRRWSGLLHQCRGTNKECPYVLTVSLVTAELAHVITAWVKVSCINLALKWEQLHWKAALAQHSVIGLAAQSSCIPTALLARGSAALKLQPTFPDGSA